MLLTYPSYFISPSNHPVRLAWAVKPVQGVFTLALPNSTYGACEGTCGTVKRLLFVTKYGDVLPCGFIHISIGNIFEEKLSDIIDRGRNIKYFAYKTPKCLSGENRTFIKKYMSKFYGKPIPVSYKEVFTEDDYVKKDWY